MLFKNLITKTSKFTRNMSDNKKSIEGFSFGDLFMFNINFCLLLISYNIRDLTEELKNHRSC